MKKLILFLVVIAIASCMPKDGKDGTNPKGGWPDDPTTDTPLVSEHTLSGKFEKGKCKRDGEVLVWPLYDGTLTQTGQHFVGFTGENGAYNIRGTFSADADDYALVYSKVDCDDEANGGTGLQELYGIRQVSDINSNVNPLTKISMPVAEDLFDAEFGTVPEVLAESERLTLEYIDMPAIEKSFGETSLEATSDSDAVLALANSMVLYQLTAPEQGDFMKEIATGITQNDLVLKEKVKQKYGKLPLKTIRGNLLNSYPTVPPFWRLKAPAYYADLWERTPNITGSVDGGLSGCTSDLPYKFYAIPYVFESWIETTKYLASNLDADISIWTRGTHIDGYDAPGTKILDIERLREKLLDSTLVHHGKLDDHGLTAGQEVYFVTTRAEPWAQTVGKDGGVLPFGRNLFGHDGINWSGHDMNLTCSDQSGLSLTGVD